MTPRPQPIPTIRSRIRALCDGPELRYRELLAEENEEDEPNPKEDQQDDDGT